MKKCQYYEYLFEDGYYCIVRGMNTLERQHEESKHGKVVQIMPL